MIYGVALLAGCMFAGQFVGNLLGYAIGLNSDVGGVGFAMLLLLLVTNSKKITSIMPQGYENGLKFWRDMFIPIIIAMSAAQNVKGALSEGLVAILAGLAAVVFAFILLILLNKLASGKRNKNEEVQE